MDSKENLFSENNKLPDLPEESQSSGDQKDLLYFDNARIRHVERMFDLFLTLFKSRHD